MAEEAAVEEAAAPPATDMGGASPLKKYGPLIVIVLLAQVVLAWVVIQYVLKENVPEREAAREELFDQPETVLEKGGEDITYQNLPYYLNVAALQDITINPAGGPSNKRKSFAVLSIELGLTGTNEDGEEMTPEEIGSDAEGAGKVQQYSGFVKSIAIEVLRSKTVDQLDSEHIPAVQEEIKKRLNKEVFGRIFKVDAENKKEFKVREAIVTKLIIQ